MVRGSHVTNLPVTWARIAGYFSCYRSYHHKTKPLMLDVSSQTYITIHPLPHQYQALLLSDQGTKPDRSLITHNALLFQKFRRPGPCLPRGRLICFRGEKLYNLICPRHGSIGALSYCNEVRMQGSRLNYLRNCGSTWRMIHSYFNRTTHYNRQSESFEVVDMIHSLPNRSSKHVPTLYVGTIS